MGKLYDFCLTSTAIPFVERERKLHFKLETGLGYSLQTELAQQFEPMGSTLRNVGFSVSLQVYLGALDATVPRIGEACI